MLKVKKAWYERTCGECYFWKHARVIPGEPCLRVLGGHKREWTACRGFMDSLPRKLEVAHV